MPRPASHGPVGNLVNDRTWIIRIAKHVEDAFYLIRLPPAAEPAIVPTIHRRTLLCAQVLPLPLADSGPIGANQRFPGQLRTLGAARRTKEPRRQLRGRRIKERASIEQ